MSESTLIVKDFGGAEGPKAPTRIGKYRIRGLLGQGTSGVVYKGYDPFVQRDVAVKISRILTKLPDEKGENFERAFFDEARAAGLLSHPHIVSLYDAGVEGDLNYIVMEYVDGETLLPWCHKNGSRMPLDGVIDIGIKCARALDYSHSRGVLHRDIKPSNVMLTRDGVPKVMDFSVALVRSADLGATGEFAVGSPLYMSPEQVARQPLNPPSDLYSLGVVLYQLLTGEPPFTGPDLPGLFIGIRNLPPPPLAERRPDLPAEFAAAVMGLLAKRPEDRPQSGRELASELLRVMERMKQADANFARRESGDSLRSLRFFDTFDDAEIDEILSASQLLSFAPGAEIVREGETDSAFYLIVRGSADVRKGRTTINTLTKGDCFGEISFLSAARRTATVTATGTSLLLKVNSTLLEQVTPECQLRFYKTFVQTLSYRLSMTNARLNALQASS
jgi:serine/threonine-protein kinase